MSEMHLISKEHLDKLGDYARNISGTTGDVTVDEMLEVFGGAQPVLEDKIITENGTYTPDSGYDGFGKVTVEVASSGGGIGISCNVKSLCMGNEIGTNSFFDVLTNLSEMSVNVSVETSVTTG